MCGLGAERDKRAPGIMQSARLNQASVGTRGVPKDYDPRRPVLVAWGAALALLAYPLMSLMARGGTGGIIAGQVRPGP
jgi:hypothetical protein